MLVAPPGATLVVVVPDERSAAAVTVAVAKAVSAIGASLCDAVTTADMPWGYSGRVDVRVVGGLAHVVVCHADFDVEMALGAPAVGGAAVWAGDGPLTQAVAEMVRAHA